ncbi:DUF1275 family protein [Nonomuraea basaltis]|uniref:DUF1275 family protein n=1 Tax=Nonomuraea basaltis TaxID=2495887 RepID=UPI00110C4948|nr:YoaK family protein [Nonomuraea basaltis]TMR93430.1 DUF1275 domain-containing protein [Nonomuraea basaltis]
MCLKRESEPTGLALVLTILAGLVDAAVFLKMGGVFVANQTGNCVLLAIGLAEHLPPDGTDEAASGVVGVTGPLTSLPAFGLGAAAAGWLGRAGVLARIWPLLGAEALLLAGVAALPGPAAVRVGMAAAAMGIQSVQAVRLGLPGVITTVVTGTVAALFARTAEQPRRRHRAAMLGMVWLLYVVGAIIGAAGARIWSLSVVCWCAVAIVGAGAVLTRQHVLPDIEDA